MDNPNGRRGAKVLIGKIIRAAVATLALSAGVGYAQDACRLGSAPGQSYAQISDFRASPATFNAAMAHQINKLRCHYGLMPVAFAPGAALVAQDHATYLSDTLQLQHTVARPGNETLGDRLRSAQLIPNRATESLIQQPLLRKGPPGTYEQLRGRTCTFINQEGRPVSRHTYRTFAQAAISIWMQIPHYRANILDPHVSGIGAGISVETERDTCGAIRAVVLLTD